MLIVARKELSTEIFFCLYERCTLYAKIRSLTNWMWLSVVCTLIENDACHHSGQNVVDSQDVAEWVHNKFWPLWWHISLSIRIQTTLNHISISFLPQYQRQRKSFFQSTSWKRHCVTHWHKQRCLDSYRQQQFSQSDCKISSNCGKKSVSKLSLGCIC